MEKGYVAFDLDGTLAYYDHWRGPEHIGEPIKPMLEVLKNFLAQGARVKIFTARVYWPDGDEKRYNEAQLAHAAIERWCSEHIGQVLEITNEKDFNMIALYDDRCVHVEQNTGRILG